MLNQLQGGKSVNPAHRMDKSPDAPQVAVLFARSKSIYRRIPGCVVYDKKRNALNYPGGLPVVADKANTCCV
jgi:hypothetical protein